MPTDADAALQLHPRAVEAFIADGRLVSAARWNQLRAPGKWSPGAAAAFEADAKSLRASAIDHPFFGRLPLLDFVRLLEIHTRHHQAQLEATGA